MKFGGGLEVWAGYQNLSWPLWWPQSFQLNLLVDSGSGGALLDEAASNETPKAGRKQLDKYLLRVAGLCWTKLQRMRHERLEVNIEYPSAGH